MAHAPRSTFPAWALALAFALHTTGDAYAQTYGGSGAWSTPPPGSPPQGSQSQGGPPQGAPPPGWSPMPAQPPPYPSSGSSSSSGSSESASALEIGSLYGVAAGYGVGAGIWLDAEFKIEDPGMRFLPPVFLGVAAPVGVFLLDRPRMKRGIPAAITAGMAIGAGEGLGIASYQFVTAKASDEWGFRGFSRTVFISSTAGGVLGYAAAVTMEPSPKTSLLLGSGVMWGTLVGSMLGYGSSTPGNDFGTSNDAASLGGLVGYNVGLAGAAALSMAWVPSYSSLAWMWIGFAAGEVVSAPIYLFYAGGDHDARRGLIFQGTAATLGLAAGAVFSMDTRDSSSLFPGITHAAERPPLVQVTGGGLMPVRNGFGINVSGLLY